MQMILVRDHYIGYGEVWGMKKCIERKGFEGECQ